MLESFLNLRVRREHLRRSNQGNDRACGEGIFGRTGLVPPAASGRNKGPLLTHFRLHAEANTDGSRVGEAFTSTRSRCPSE